MEFGPVLASSFDFNILYMLINLLPSFHIGFNCNKMVESLYISTLNGYIFTLLVDLNIFPFNHILQTYYSVLSLLSTIALWKYFQYLLNFFIQLITFKYVKTTVPADRNLFYQYGIRALPTLLLADASGKEIKRMTPGIKNPAAVRALIQSINRS